MTTSFVDEVSAEEDLDVELNVLSDVVTWIDVEDEEPLDTDLLLVLSTTVDVSVDADSLAEVIEIVSVEDVDEVTVVEIALTGSKTIPTSAQLPGVLSSWMDAGKFVGEGTVETAYSA